MRVNNIIRENVVDFGQQRRKKRQEVQQHQEAKKSVAMDMVDHAVAAAIDHLKRTGMNDREAYSAVMTHLSDLVMAHDMQGGPVD